MRWVPILALVAVGTMINYLDRTVLGIAAPFLTKDLGLTAAKMGLVFSAFSWSYALLQIPGGIFLDRFGTRLTYFIAVVCWSACTALMGVVRSLNGAGPDADRRRRLRSAVLSRQQPDSGDLVSAAGTRARELDLFLRPVRRPGLPQRAAVLDHAAIRLARPVLHRRRLRHRVRHRVAAAVSRAGGRAGRANRAEIDYIEAGGGGEYKGAAGHVQVASHRGAAALPAGAGRLARTVRRQLDAGVLRHLVSDLSRHRARDDVHPGRADDLAAVHRRVGRRARRRADLGHDPQANRIGEPVAEAADRRRHAAGVDDRRRQLRADRAATAS